MRRRGFLLLMLAVACGAHAAVPAAVPPYIAQELPDARESGRGVFRWFGLSVYEAVLWTGPAGYQPGQPFVLELRYAMRLKGGKIAEASAEQMEHIGAGNAQQRAAWLRDMRALFPDVAAGQHLSGSFVPGMGARFHSDGRLIGVVRDAEFAEAFFGIWLSPATSAPELRRQLLGNARGPAR
ncbi:chalcone isomerase family protein [Massilia sp. SM-13]|uniref:chalcone isomerase family protein n=1 Tax=Pseudoduganella rhizocola TaxID=3382643 RepID=UPI0038B5A61A